ncbi:uncharacterized protein LOC591669 [Strongylocentrotus purpuratus]|uniref:Cupin-like domain-containing protein n=1 Tax=Strongylocentrotus purpuratus TaxID=7668 RepID=A0A7M7P7Y3_STRPU|nr:uncharacterized protein LOC591669 [Strongylocentrotus purpuratus]
MDGSKSKLINSLSKLKADAVKAGLTLAEVEHVLLAKCSDSAKREGHASSLAAKGSGDHAYGNSAGSRSLPSALITVFLRFLTPLLLCSAGALSCLHYFGHLSSLTGILTENPCLLEANLLLVEISRPIEKCDFCEGLTSFPTYRDISREDYLDIHAYTGRPALIQEGGTKNWTAPDVFSVKFFQNLYKDNERALEAQENCQFFPYKSGIESFEEFLNMSDEKADFKEEPWYVGWSNCDTVIAAELRRHYTLPHFLPEGSESSITDWIFIGGPGHGANVHIDSVDRPSWQAQIRGSKTWTLIPPPECEHVCHEINATMVKGSVIVVDTNRWYHKTDIHPGGISITIGSEYD